MQISFTLATKSDLEFRKVAPARLLETQEAHKLLTQRMNSLIRKRWAKGPCLQANIGLERGRRLPFGTHGKYTL
ncbi:uncharacterized protein N7496_006599 [Penicillium cataractarum]|uniref:Uncharacterized protein n=1 Tax=Penicillium cataractarum TaxID=2100454 RepID=A0A9W9S1T7_9EURO|nr:uncharacterized protein N7496_006599 [Penicillium cataractarum]KAJ5370507.1 hypothetical protein N7496_006599 [Penicillium cataractarum]